MDDYVEQANDWLAGDPDEETRAALAGLVADGDAAGLEAAMGKRLEFGTAGIRGVVGPGPGQMNRAVVMQTTFGLARYLESRYAADAGPIVVGFDARPTSRVFAEDTAGVLAAAGRPVLYFPNVTPTPLVAFAAKHLRAIAAVVVTASHNPPADNGYKVYGSDAAQIVPPVDTEIQHAIEMAPPAATIERVAQVFEGRSDLVVPIGGDIIDCYWEEVSSYRSRHTGSDLAIVYTPMHGVGRDTLLDIMGRAGHVAVTPVPAQADPDGTFPTVAFPNPEEPGALDLALELATSNEADLVVANDPDADRLAAVVPIDGRWRQLSGNELGVLLGDYMLAHAASPEEAIVVNSVVSSPMLASIAHSYGARHTKTLTGFKWIVKAASGLEEKGEGRFLFGYEEALGYTVGGTVRDKDGISAALLFVDLVADLRDEGRTVGDYLVDLWAKHRLWVSGQVSVVRPGPEGAEEMRAAVEQLAGNPPGEIAGLEVTAITDYRVGAEERPSWLGAQDLVELGLGEAGRVLVRPSGTEPKLKIYVDLAEVPGSSPFARHDALTERASEVGKSVAASVGL